MSMQDDWEVMNTRHGEDDADKHPGPGWEPFAVVHEPGITTWTTVIYWRRRKQ